MTYIMTTPNKGRLTALHKICGHIFRHSAQKFLEIRQYVCELSVQSDEKSDFASFAQALYGVALYILSQIMHFVNFE